VTEARATEILKALGEPFPKTAVKQREGARGRRFDYIETHTCIHRLNSAAGAWDFRILNAEFRADLLIVQGELTIPGLGTRSGFGVQQVAPGAGEDLVKGAASDCLKKCATLFGVALELYGPDYESGEVATPSQGQPRQAAPTRSGGGPNDKQMGLLRHLIRSLNLSEEQLNMYVEKEYGAPLDAIAGRDVSNLIDRLKAKVDSLATEPQAEDF
jgi:hypothetical protein